MDSHGSGSEYGGSQNDRRMETEQVRALRAELSKLQHLDSEAPRSNRSASRKASAERRLHERQDNMDKRLEQLTKVILEQQKNIHNLLDPLGADIARRFEESDRKMTEMQSDLKREAKDMRRKIRQYEADLQCISQQIEANGDDYQECDEDADDATSAALQQQVRRDLEFGDVTYEELHDCLLAAHATCSISYVNEHWSFLDIVTDGVFTLRPDPLKPSAAYPPASEQPPLAAVEKDHTERRLFSPAVRSWAQSLVTAEPGATTYLARAPSFEPQGGVAQVNVPGPSSMPLEVAGNLHTMPKPLILDAAEGDRRKSVREKLVAQSVPEASEEQLQKSVESIRNFPTCSDATELESFLTKIVAEIRTVSKDPDLMCRWLREATTSAVVKTPAGFDEWFDHMAVSGKGFVRTDVLLLKHILIATRRAAHLRTRISTKEQEFLKRGLNFRGRQALIMVREQFRESQTDREHTDRRRIDAVHLQGDNIEGYWGKFVLTLSEQHPVRLLPPG